MKTPEQIGFAQIVAGPFGRAHGVSLLPVPLFGIRRHRKDRVVAKVAALMHELGEILGETSIPNRSPYLSSAA